MPWRTLLADTLPLTITSGLHLILKQVPCWLKRQLNESTALKNKNANGGAYVLQCPASQEHRDLWETRFVQINKSPSLRLQGTALVFNGLGRFIPFLIQTTKNRRKQKRSSFKTTAEPLTVTRYRLSAGLWIEFHCLLNSITKLDRDFRNCTSVPVCPVTLQNLRSVKAVLNLKFKQRICIMRRHKPSRINT
ncbi:hypothetical protein Baya_6098 [Bagarius yarrelli]|uniref:Uncharacterized protein n=1 Tax=Bagarius yarrelli TaxID=175774 RepID=A0A556U4Z7_BAGYA|nr:hypothetical protein Baya_6098 [Bagarius yarrelli]